MHVNDLPDDVLALVFRAALPAIKRQLAHVRGGLGLLSVCRRWRGVALPMVYDTVVVKCGAKSADEPENVDIKTTLELMVDAQCLHMVRRVVIDVCYRISPLQGLKAVIEMMHGAAGKWAGMRKLEISLDAWGSEEGDEYLPAADYEDEISNVCSALSALMPGLREITFDDFSQTPIARVLFGQLAAFYADQLQVLHSNSRFLVPQDLVFARLRDVTITGFFYGSLEGQLPRLDPEVVESLVLRGLAANDMWSMFCADSDGCAITFPQLTSLNLGYRQRHRMSSDQPSDERPWALQFPAAKNVRISCDDDQCPSMENAVFPSRMESLDISGCLCMFPVIAGRKVHVSRSLALSVDYKHDASNRDIEIANCMLAESSSHNMRKLVIHCVDAIPLELVTYTGLTHLQLDVPTTADDVMGLIHRQRQLVSLRVSRLTLADAQTDFSIPECAEHEPMAPLDTQIKRFGILRVEQGELTELALSILKYLLLRISTLNSVTALFMPWEQIQAFIDKYVQCYPHLDNIWFDCVK